MDCDITVENLPKLAKKWMEEIEPYNVHDFTLNPDKAALMVVDMQNFFLDPDSPTYTCGGEAILPNLQKLIGLFRDNDRPVIYTRHVHHPDGIDAGIMGWWWEGMCREGTPESEIFKSVAPKPGEKIILKHRYSAFYNTDLETILRCQKIEDLVIGGVMTNMCCESTARDAYYRDYRVFFPADATGTVSEGMHRASLLNLSFGFARVLLTDTIIKEAQ